MEETKKITIEAKGNKRKNSTVWYTMNRPHGKKRLHHSMKLVEMCQQQGNNLYKRQLQAQWATEVTQNRWKIWQEKRLKLNKFQPGQLVLKYSEWNEIKLGKFKVKWVGPYQIREVGNNEAIKLWTLYGTKYQKQSMVQS